MKQTTNFHLNKPDTTDYYNIQDSNNNMDIIDAEIKEAQDKADQAFQSASNGKVAIKTAITGVDPTVTIPTDATFNQLATAISQIKTGVDTEDATATAAQILANMTAYVKGVKITGKAADNGPIAAETVNLTAQNQEYTIASGFHSGLRKIKAVITNLSAGVIKAGVTVGGIAGTFTADATAGDTTVLNGYTYYRNGVKGTGSMPNKDTSTNWAAQDVYTSGSTVLFKPQPGCYTPGGSSSTPNALGGWVTATSVDLLAANILSGKSIFGVTGTAITGKRFQTGWVTSSANADRLQAYLYYSQSSTVQKYYITVSGLTFTPSIIIAYGNIAGTTCAVFYSSITGFVGVYDNPYLYLFLANAGAFYVNSTGFRLPSSDYGNFSYQWIAVE